MQRGLGNPLTFKLVDVEVEQAVLLPDFQLDFLRLTAVAVHLIFVGRREPHVAADRALDFRAVRQPSQERRA